MSDLDPKDAELEAKLSAQADELEDEDDETSRTPFDHPFFLPILLLLAMLWFAYDGWFTTDEEMQQWKTFNRVGAAVLFFFAAMTTRSALKEMARVREGMQKNSTPEE